MRIAVDAFPLAARSASGIPNYLRGTLRALAALDGENRYYLYSRNPVAFAPGGNFAARSSPRAKEGSTSYGNTAWLFTRGVMMMRKDGVQVFWGPRHMLPPVLPGGVRSVLTVHDLVWRHYPETMERYNLLIMKAVAERSIRAADHIIAVSEATARSLAEVFAVPRERITVVHNGAGDYSPLDREESALYISGRYGVLKKYFLTVSTVEPRKNLVTLLRAFSRLGAGGVQLVVAGASGWKTSGLSREYERLGLTEDRVKFLGFVPQEDMNRLYSGAALFLFPSIYEGFGMPPLEAMASGTPVIASNSSSLPEVVGDAGVLLDPMDEDAWAEAMAGALARPEGMEATREAALRRARSFSWEKAARETLGVFQRVLGAPRTG
ncbi:MAG: glycosyltransferase family 1 protein [Thermodesulfovibrionales bacterium]